jgi:hypothetical protein
MSRRGKWLEGAWTDQTLGLYTQCWQRKRRYVRHAGIEKPFGHASQARSLIILKDPKTGHLFLDLKRAEISKNAVAQGILRRIRQVPGDFPPDKSEPGKKDLRAIAAIREEFHVPI